LSELINSFGYRHAFRYLSSSRARPWDDRDLDCIEGLKCFNFILGGISVTSVWFYFTAFKNYFGIFGILQNPLTGIFIAANMAVETFLFFSSFTLTHRCYQIMDAKGGQILSVFDYLKILARKLVRLAPAYYLMWFVLWCLTSRIAKGSYFYNSETVFEDCKDELVPTLLWFANLLPSQGPYMGCYPQSFPLQLDL
jgi:peptidoglycan/LPS O-acetylase OafA/YrhL